MAHAYTANTKRGRHTMTDHTPENPDNGEGDNGNQHVDGGNEHSNAYTA
jgi:hypothetical protein